MGPWLTALEKHKSEILRIWPHGVEGAGEEKPRLTPSSHLRACKNKGPRPLGTTAPSWAVIFGVDIICSRFPSGAENAVKTHKCGILN